jgi:hypothetical protein
VAHQLIDHPGRDAVVLQPGREGVPQIVPAAQVKADQLPCLVACRTGNSKHPPAYADDQPVEVMDTISHGEVVSFRFEVQV